MCYESGQPSWCGGPGGKKKWVLEIRSLLANWAQGGYAPPCLDCSCISPYRHNPPICMVAYHLICFAIEWCILATYFLDIHILYCLLRSTGTHPRCWIMKSTTPKRIKLSRGSFFEIKLGRIGKIKSKKVAFSRSQKQSDALDVQLRTLCILPKRDFQSLDNCNGWQASQICRKVKISHFKHMSLLFPI